MIKSLKSLFCCHSSSETAPRPPRPPAERPIPTTIETIVRPVFAEIMIQPTNQEEVTSNHSSDEADEGFLTSTSAASIFSSNQEMLPLEPDLNDLFSVSSSTDTSSDSSYLPSETVAALNALGGIAPLRRAHPLPPVQPPILPGSPDLDQAGGEPVYF